MKTVEDIVSICLQDKDFYEESNGGVTISGGEALMQPAFLEKLVASLHEQGIHVALETTGFCAPATFQRLAPLFDLVPVRHQTPRFNKTPGDDRCCK